MTFRDKNQDGIIQYAGPLAYRTEDGTLEVAKSQDDKKRLAMSRKTLQELKLQLSDAQQQDGGPGEVQRLENEIAELEQRAYPNELIFGADIMVMANPYMADVPPWAIALLMAGCIAAALSTAAGLLLVLSTSISHDLMKKILKI